MKSFNWADLLRHHPIFSSLDEEEMTQLLKNEVSQERAYPQGHMILREGDVGDSIFLIGSGSVQVTLHGTAGQEIPLSILKEGELFGEMAVLARQPRSATVMARENCTLLEVRGQEFLKLLQEHPDMLSQVRAKMSERLKHSRQE